MLRTVDSVEANFDLEKARGGVEAWNGGSVEAPGRLHGDSQDSVSQPGVSFLVFFS